MRWQVADTAQYPGLLREKQLREDHTASRDPASPSLAQTAVCKVRWGTSPRGRVPPPRHLPLIAWLLTFVASGRLDTCVGQRAPEGLVCVWVTQLCLSLWPDGLQPIRLLCPWDSPSKNTGVGCHALLQGGLPDPGMEPRSPTLQADSLPRGW